MQICCTEAVVDSVRIAAQEDRKCPKYRHPAERRSGTQPVSLLANIEHGAGLARIFRMRCLRTVSPAPESTAVSVSHRRHSCPVSRDELSAAQGKKGR